MKRRRSKKVKVKLRQDGGRMEEYMKRRRRRKEE